MLPGDYDTTLFEAESLLLLRYVLHQPLFLSSTLGSRKCLSIESTSMKGTLTAEVSHGPSYEESVL